MYTPEAMKRSARFPLWLHRSGNWCKKHRGKFYYFGHDRDAALRLYTAQWPAILAGADDQPVKSEADTLTLRMAVNEYLTTKLAAVDAGEISARWHADLKAACKVLLGLGADRPVVTLRPSDFAKLRAAASVDLGPVALGNFVQRVRGVFKWLYESELIDKPIRFGPDFEKPPRRLVRLNRADSGPKMLEPEDCRRLIESANPQLRAMILLALNCGFGQTDCSELPRSAVKMGWIDFRRPKTGAPRRCPLWPETEAAIASLPIGDSVFVTEGGHKLVRMGRHRIDSVALAYGRLARRLGIAQTGFYTLRHVHRTIAGEAKDRDAAGLIMGHVDDSMAGNYVQAISDERLKAVTDKIHDWLFRKTQ